MAMPLETVISKKNIDKFCKLIKNGHCQIIEK